MIDSMQKHAKIMMNEHWMMSEMPHALMFHHFSSPTDSSTVQGAINSEEFSLILEYCCDKYTLLGANEFYSRAISNRLEKKDITLTFDDCLKSQFTIAYPIIKSMKIDSFFFAYNDAFDETSGALEFYRDFRNNYFNSIDEFYEEFMQKFAKLYPENYSYYQDSFPADHLSHCKFYTENDRRFRFARDQALYEEKYAFIMEEMMRLKKYNKDERKKIIFMSTEELVEISKNGDTIGLHSKSHPTCIEKYEYESQLNEYQENLRFVTNVTGSKPRSMSHPNGKYNNDTLQILELLGIEVGFRSNMNQEFSKSLLEIPREDHSNILSKIRQATSIS